MAPKVYNLEDLSWEPSIDEITNKIITKILTITKKPTNFVYRGIFYGDRDLPTIMGRGTDRTLQGWDDAAIRLTQMDKHKSPIEAKKLTDPRYIWASTFENISGALDGDVASHNALLAYELSSLNQPDNYYHPEMYGFISTPSEALRFAIQF